MAKTKTILEKDVRVMSMSRCIDIPEQTTICGAGDGSVEDVIDHILAILY
jgi:hypothetical protein